MAFLVTSVWEDCNGERATLSWYVGTEAEAMTSLATMDAVTNAYCVSASLDTPVPLQALTNNDAVAQNVETARAKAEVRFRGADAGSLAAPFDYVTLQIPAPIGSLIDGKFGNTQNTDLVNLTGKILSDSGVTMASVDYVKYKR